LPRLIKASQFSRKISWKQKSIIGVEIESWSAVVQWRIRNIALIPGIVSVEVGDVGPPFCDRKIL